MTAAIVACGSYAACHMTNGSAPGLHGAVNSDLTALLWQLVSTRLRATADGAKFLTPLKNRQSSLADPRMLGCA